ncbi:SIR2 family protein [Halovibrio salipaludis]|uniref:hypothetical protein n=1 Tax=Halovibrio salipaludis TaxID=2032626 RepID=UPI0018E93AAC|nr:hypothetical protein [Halovibrio salipaludis]
MPAIPPMDGNVNHAPHVVILGAGASIAAYLDWGSEGDELPSMQGLIDTIGLREDIENAGFEVVNLNFEAFYDELASSGEYPDLLSKIESKVYDYFSSLSLPEKPTIYDYLVLSLREKDIIATFNWDPFLLQAYMRNEGVAKGRRPQLAFLHGNVSIGICEKDKVSGVKGEVCSQCKQPLSPSRLLYPVKHKDYNSDPFIRGEWDALRTNLNYGYFLTVFGYSAPKTDIEARTLMLEVWEDNKSLELAEVEVIDIRPKEDVEDSWNEFIFSHHYMIVEDIFSSYLFTHPRRSCDAFSSATLMCSPWHDNPYPRFEELSELQEWVRPLIEEEQRYDKKKERFSGEPLQPNTGG